MDMKDALTLGKLIDQKDETLTVSAVAKQLKVHPDTIRRWVNSGHLRCTRHPINNYRIFLMKDLVELLNNGEVK